MANGGVSFNKWQMEEWLFGKWQSTRWLFGLALFLASRQTNKQNNLIFRIISHHSAHCAEVLVEQKITVEVLFLQTTAQVRRTFQHFLINLFSLRSPKDSIPHPRNE